MSANTASEIDALNDTLSAVFSALSDPTRRAMLARLSQGEASVNELAAPFKMSLPAVSKHIKILERANSTVVGTLQSSKNFFYVIPDDPRLQHDIYVRPAAGARNCSRRCPRSSGASCTSPSATTPT